MQELLNSFLENWESTEQEWQEISSRIKKEENPSFVCFKGCGTCCHFPLISASTGEAFLLYHLLKNIYHESLDILLKDYASLYFRLVQKYGGLPFLEETRTLFFQEKLPCPFLNQEGACSIYGLRPLICSFYHNTESVSLCEEKKPHRVHEELVREGERLLLERKGFEHQLLGHSALGHLPLLMAACTSPSYLEKYTQGYEDRQENEERNLELFLLVYESLGYQVTSSDLENWSLEKEGEQE